MDRTNPKILKGLLKFQIIDWVIPNFYEQIDLENNEECDEYYRKPNEYDINVYGVTVKGETVFSVIKGFEPYFYVRAPLHMTNKTTIKKFIYNNLQKYLESGSFKYNVPKYNSNEFEIKHGLRESEYEKIQFLCVKKNDFWGYSKEKRWFLKIVTPNKTLFKTMQYIFQEFNKINNIGIWKLYETNIDPFIRFIHEKEIKPSGWVSIDLDKADVIEIPNSNCNYSCMIHKDYIVNENINNIAPLLIASFDIECNSSSGDFPLAIKPYKRLAQDLCENNDFIIENKIDLYLIIVELLSNNYQLNKTRIINKINTKYYPTENQLNQLNKVIPIILEYLNDIYTNYKNLKQQDILEIENKIIIILKKVLPGLKGDSIIQIGTTFHIYGSDKIVYKHLANLGTCDNIDGVDVIQCKNEKELLLNWKQMIMDKNPDILTGYNIFGFDFKYIQDRCLELNMLELFLSDFGKSNKINAKFENKTLTSSALGEVNTYFLKIEGVLVIDMYTYVKSPTILTLDSYKLNDVCNSVFGESKLDLKPHEIFSKYKGSSLDRMEIGVYCIQDCKLVNKLFQKLKVLENNIGMSNVCLVPLSYIFNRGQGIKIYSLVMYECSKRNQVIPYREKMDDGMYEGAIVLEPKTGIYMDDPIVVFDYSSLYPNSMIAENLSHDSHILPHEIDKYVKNDKLIEEDENLELNKITIDDICHYYVKFKNGKKSTIPQILEMLIKQRKTTRAYIASKTITTSKNIYKGIYNKVQNTIKNIETNQIYNISSEEILEIKDTYTDFEKDVFDSLQSAYKVTANSLYGQTGAKTSPIYLKSIAECTTATGRTMILKAKKFVEDTYNADVIYGDTDSIFCKFKLENKGKAAVAEAIEKGLQVEKEIAKIMEIHKPQALNYEKVLYPFILFSKKRYVGLLYETDHTKCKEKSMGIALKRRDYSKIMKEVYGSIIHKILWENDLKGSFNILDEYLKKIVKGDVDLDSLIISKNLKSSYKDPSRIAHKVLADRITERDPGNKPQINDRLPYIYIDINDSKALQGNRIETKEFILNNPDIKIDYLYYIKNQIMNPVVQLYTLCIEQIPDYNYPTNYWELQDIELKKTTFYSNDNKRKNRIDSLKENIVQRILFEHYIKLLEHITYDTNGNVITKKPSSFVKEIVQLDHKSMKDTLENIEIFITIKNKIKTNKLQIIIQNNKVIKDLKILQEIKNKTIQIKTEIKDLKTKINDITEYDLNKNHIKEVIITKWIEEYIELNIDKYITFHIKGCSKLVNNFSEIKEIVQDNSDNLWLNMKQSILFIFTPIIRYYHRINITGVK